MKLLRCSILCFVFSLMYSCVNTLVGRGALPTEYSKTIQKSFDIATDAEVLVSNKYGNVTIYTADVPKVSFEIIITTKAKDKSDAEVIFERIRIDFDHDYDAVRAQTIIEDTKSWKKWFGKNYDDFQIDYFVTLPKTVELDIENKYGNVSIPDMSNDVDLEVKYGNSRVGSLRGYDLDAVIGYGNLTLEYADNLDLEMKYGNLEVGNISGVADLEIKYTNIDVHKVGSIDLESKYGKYEIDSVGNLTNDGKYDSFRIDYIEDVSIESAYTKIRVGTLARRASFDLRYGGITIKKVPYGFEDLQAELDYTDLTLETKNDFKLQFDGRYNSQNIRQSMQIIKQIEESNSVSLEAQVGRNPQTNIDVSMNYGKLTID